METDLLNLATTNLNDTLAELEDHIKNIALAYEKAADRAKVLIADVDRETALTMLAGTPGYAYLKQRGHKSLSSEDIATIINRMGTEEEKKAVSSFPHAQKSLTDRLKGNAVIGLILKQAKVTYDQYYQRQSLPERWTPKQMVAVVDVLDRLRV